MANISIEMAMEKYQIGKKPLALVLGFGETALFNISDKHIKILEDIYFNENNYYDYLIKNKDKITPLAFKKSMNAVQTYLDEDTLLKPLENFFRVAASTIKISVADVKKNSERIIEEYKKAVKNKVQLLILNELCITGYTCQDLFMQERLLKATEEAIIEIANYTTGNELLLVVGAPIRFNAKLYNCAVVIQDGKILGVVPKSHIPNYNEFYEVRHFVSGIDIKDQQIDIDGVLAPFGVDLLFKSNKNKNVVIGIEICEDLWVSIPPSAYLANAGASIICNLSASNEVIGKSDYRRDLVCNQSARLDCAYVYASAGDGESTQDLVFSGHNIIAEEGQILKETHLFNNEMIISEIDIEKITHERQRRNTFEIKNNSYRTILFNQEQEQLIISRKYDRFPFVPHDESKREKRCEQILLMQANALKKRIEHINCKKIVVGLSGGLDSALAILVAAKAMDLLNRDRKDIIAITMPCFGTTKRTKSNAELLAEGLNTSFMDINISKAVEEHFKDIDQDMQKYDVTFENGQARERTQVLMDIGNKVGGIVLGTGDLSELALGWATYNGDHMSMYAVNVSIPKTLVRYIVKYYADTTKEKSTAKALYDILDTPVSPELLPAINGEISQKTELLVGPYELHDFFLYYVMRWGFSAKKILIMAYNTFKGVYEKEVIYKWLKNFYNRFFSQQFKRSCLPDGPKVGSCVLSPRGDWRMPSDASNRIFIEELD